MSQMLFDLVNSLTISEKVYFKRNAKIHDAKENKNYLKIYNVYEKMAHYDRQAIIDSFNNTSIKKYISSEENYLKDKLLISLFNFNLGRSTRNQIQKGILLIEVLANKGFRKEALKKLKSIKKKAIKQEEFMLILRLIELEENILFKEGIIGYKDNLHKLHQERKSITKTIDNLNVYHILRQDIRELQFREDLIVNPRKALKEIDDNPLIPNINKCLSAQAKEHWYYIHVLLNYLKRRFDKGLLAASKHVNFLLESRNLFDKTKILPALSNYIYHAALTSDSEHFNRGIGFLNDFFDKREISQQYLKYILYSRTLEFAYYSKVHETTKEYIQLTYDLIDKQGQHLEEAQVQYLFLVIVRGAILIKDNDKAMEYCNLWQRRGVMQYRKLQAILFSLMINFELNHLELIRSEIVLFKKLEADYKREKKLIAVFYSFFSSILKNPNDRDRPILKLQKELKSISLKNKKYFDFISFDYYEWSLRLK